MSHPPGGVPPYGSAPHAGMPMHGGMPPAAFGGFPPFGGMMPPMMAPFGQYPPGPGHFSPYGHGFPGGAPSPWMMPNGMPAAQTARPALAPPGVELQADTPVEDATKSSSTSSSATTAASAALPAGWNIYYTPEGKPYYADPEGKTHWALPSGTPTVPDGAQRLWTEHRTPEDQTYYYNAVTKTSVWTKPADFDATVPVDATPALATAAAEVVDSASSSFTEPSAVSSAVSTGAASAGSVSSEAFPPTNQTVTQHAVTASAESDDDDDDDGSPEPAGESSTAAPANSASHSTTVPSSTVKSSDSSTVHASKAGGSSKNQPAAAPKPKSKREAKRLLREQKEKEERERKAASVAPEAIPVRIRRVTTDATAPPTVVKPAEPTAENEEQAAEMFRAMLREKGVQPEWSWDDAFRVIVFDPRYKLIPRADQRKEIFNAFQEVERKRTDEERRSRRQTAKVEFLKLLEEVTEVDEHTKLRQLEERLEKDPRYVAFDDSTERADLLADLLQDRKRKAIEKSRQERVTKLLAFEEYLRGPGAALFTVDTTWSEAQKILHEQQQPEYMALPRADVGRVFNQYRDQLIEARRQKQQEELLERRKREKQCRDDYRALLRQLQESAQIHGRTRWRDIEPVVQSHAAFIALAESKQSNCSPKDMFRDFMDDFDEAVEKDKKSLKRALKDVHFKPKASLSLPEFEESIRSALGAEAPALQKVSPLHLKVLAAEMLDKAKSKAADKEAKKRARSEPYIKMLQHVLPLPYLLNDLHVVLPTEIPSSAEEKSKKFSAACRNIWMALAPFKGLDITRSKEYSGLDGPEEATALFERYIAMLATGGAAPAAVEDAVAGSGSPVKRKAEHEENGQSKRQKQEEDKDSTPAASATAAVSKALGSDGATAAPTPMEAQDHPAAKRGRSSSSSSSEDDRERSPKKKKKHSSRKRSPKSKR